jgi:hypothetical protein
MQDLHSFIYPLAVIPPVSVSNNTAQVGSVVDLASVLNVAGNSVGGFDGLEFITNIGSVADADATFTVLVEDSDDNITFTAVSDDFLIGTEAEASFRYDSDNTCKRIGYIGSKRYVRYTITPANNASAAVFGVIALPAYARSAPVENN